jgi:hypothetical protein
MLPQLGVVAVNTDVAKLAPERLAANAVISLAEPHVVVLFDAHRAASAAE